MPSRSETTRGELYVKLNANFADHPKVIDAGPLAELVYVRGLQLSKRTMSDGVISDGQSDRLVADLGSLSDVAGDPIGALITVGLWIKVDGGYRIVGWLERNPSREQIQCPKESMDRGNHTRWHVNKGKRDPECLWCMGPEPDNGSDIPSESNGTPIGSSGDDPGMIRGSPSRVRDRAAAGSDDPGTIRSDPPADRSPTDRVTILTEACCLLADRTLATRQHRGNNPDAYRATIIKALVTEHRDEGMRLLGVNREWTAERLADELAAEPDRIPDSERRRPVGWTLGDPDHTCDGTGRVLDDDGTVVGECGCVPEWQTRIGATPVLAAVPDP